MHDFIISIAMMEHTVSSVTSALRMLRIPRLRGKMAITITQPFVLFFFAKKKNSSIIGDEFRSYPE